MSGKASVVFDGIVGMEAKIFQIKFVFRIGFVEEASREVGDEEAEGRGEVEGFADFGVEVFEGDVLAVVRKDAVVGHGVLNITGLELSSW